MINLPSKFADQLKQQNTPSVIVQLGDTPVLAEETTQADWIANSGESNVDYTPSPPDSGDVILASQAESYTGKAGHTQRYDHSAVNINGTMYILGGVISLTAPKTAIETWAKYVIATNTWTAMPVLAGLGRCGHTAVTDGVNLMYITNGRNTRDTEADAAVYLDHRVYSVSTATWTVLKPPPVKFYDAAGALHNGKIYISGGQAPGPPLSTLYVYDIAANSWSTLASMPRQFDRHSMVAWPDGGDAGQLIVFGGHNYLIGSVTDEVWIYDIATNGWTQSTSGATARFAHAATIFGDRMIISGGKLNSGGYMADLWEFNLSDKTWIQRASNSHNYARHTAVAEGSKIILHAGRDSTNTWSGTDSYQAVIFQASGWIKTQAMDLGSVPTNNGTWVFSDIVPAGTTLTRQAWASDTGAFAGEEDSLGTVVDGDAILPRRYFMVREDLTSDANGLKSPTIKSIMANFTPFITLSDNNSLGFEAAVRSITSLTTKIDTFDKATISAVSVKLVLVDTVSEWLATKYPKNKLVRIGVGFAASGFKAADYQAFFVGIVDTWKIGKEGVTLTLKDHKARWDVDVPLKWESTADDVTWTNQHPVDVMDDIIRNYINERDSRIDLDSFQLVKTKLAGWVVTRTITSNPERAKELLEELRVLTSTFFIISGDGRIGLKLWDAAEGPVDTLSTEGEDNALDHNYDGNGGALINEVIHYFAYDGAGSDASDFASATISLNSASITNNDEVTPKEIKDKWTGAAQSEQVTTLANNILNRYADPPALITIKGGLVNYALEIGDIVNITTRRAPSSDMSGIAQKPFQIVRRNVDFSAKSISFTCLEV